jgi:hypothetical protein
MLLLHVMRCLNYTICLFFCDYVCNQYLSCRINFKGDLIVSSPDVSLVELGPDVEFVLLATDGLWDYIKRYVHKSFYCVVVLLIFVLVCLLKTS